MRPFVRLAPAALMLGVAATALIATPTLVRQIGHASTDARITLAKRTIDSDDILERIDRAQVAIADAVRPGVVHIDVRSRADEQRPWRFGGSSGAGWVFDREGHIITNAHVVRGASSRITVEFASGLSAAAELVGADLYTDIAVLRVSGINGGLFPLERATGEPVRQGQQVFAFGSPFGFKHSMSRGIVSGLGRDPRGAVVPEGFTNFIQTDAAVNPGNSGGPIVDARGRVIGMNVAIATGRESDGTMEGQSAGISFAIPLNVIENVATQLIQSGEVRRGFLGINFNTGTPSTVALSPTEYTTGVRIMGVVEGSAAETAGLRPDDVIVSFGGQPTPNAAVLRSLITSFGPGSTLEAVVYREDRPVTARLTLGEFPRQAFALAPVLSTMRGVGIGFRQPVGEARPARIQEVLTGSWAAEVGIEPGDQIVRVAGAPVENLGDMAVRLEAGGLLLGSPIELTLRKRDGRTQTVHLPAIPRGR